MAQAKARPPEETRSSWVDGLVEGVAGLLVLVGWPSAVVLGLAHAWGSLFTSDVYVDVGRAVILAVACFTAMAFAVMGLGPWAAGQTGRDSFEPLSAPSFLLLAAISLGPTIVLALVFYGHL